MINLTRMNNTVITVNDDLIETMEETPDTVITLTTGKKLVVNESIETIVSLIKEYKKELFKQDFLLGR